MAVNKFLYSLEHFQKEKFRLRILKVSKFHSEDFVSYLRVFLNYLKGAKTLNVLSFKNQKAFGNSVMKSALQSFIVLSHTETSESFILITEKENKRHSKQISAECEAAHTSLSTFTQGKSS